MNTNKMYNDKNLLENNGNKCSLKDFFEDDNLLNTPKIQLELKPKKFYTDINIYTKEKTDIKTAQKIEGALSIIGKVKYIKVNCGYDISVACTLNEWDYNYNKSIPENFQKNVKKIVINLMEKTKLRSYRLSIYRKEVGSDEITDKIHIDIARKNGKWISQY
ncbi:hypothetical protein [Caminicella sporogenes]|uniref:hypothetical protein n=1 Tax=Caminicella sporogenes TaxID=166485 RepID=UPI0025402DCA|nr:hypothetical protein [Caminicella sporogenes]WIF94469.1 hypothetical protein QNI18_09385 [Caminicella sporogenes]